jgi:signal transduction histidine kinase
MRWLVAAMVFGAIFPLVGWIVAMSGAAVGSLATAHQTQPVLYIVDLAPLVLGVTGYAIGHFHARLLKIRHSIEQTVHTRTAELEQALDDLSATQADKDRFVASVSHELRTPLTSVVGLAHTLADSADEFSTDERHELLDLIVSESEEVAAIVEDLLVAARVESGELSMASEPLRLDDELRAMVEVCEIEVEPRRIEPVTVMGDAIRIHQIVRNLITNADRYGGSTVLVEVFAEGPTAILAVRDNGDGVPADKLDLVFTAFGKAHQDPTRSDAVGLGLAVSQNLAQLMGGDVIYEQTAGWTSFELHLPVADHGSSGSSEGRSTSTREDVAYARTA